MFSWWWGPICMYLLRRQPLKVIRVLNQLITIQRVVCLVVMGYRKLLKAEKEKGRHNNRHKTSSDIFIHGDEHAALIP